MKKIFYKLLYVIVVLIANYLQGQPPLISTSFPTSVPASPTVAGLMKFEEVPVNNYTGIPNINIPLFSVQSRAKEVALNISLNYHPSSVAVNEVASFVGLGWNLFAGGSISRTVRGLPDEMNEMNGLQRKGIYNDNYYELYAETDMANQNDYLNFVGKDDSKKFIWEAVEKGIRDTEHDLYQYNFMGYSGRFYMKKNLGNYTIEKLDNDNNIRIRYSGGIFTLTDDKGYQCIFNVTENTQVRTLNSVHYFRGGPLTEIYPESLTSYEYISAYHLSKVVDNNLSPDARDLITFNYFAETFDEISNTISETRNEILSPSIDAIISLMVNGCDGEMFGRIEPEQIRVDQRRTTQTKKIQSIFVPNKAKIYFSLINDRVDKVPDVPSQKWRLNQVTVNDWSGNQVKKFDLNHAYSQIKAGYTRMLLGSVIENDTQTYALTYKESGIDPNNPNIGTDYWGYYNLRPSNKGYGVYREASSAMCTLDVLTSMKLPTGGTIEYNFESNDYSYNGAIRLEDFSENPDRFLEAVQSVMHNSTDSIRYADCPASQDWNCWSFKLDDPQTVSFTANRDPRYPSVNWGIVVIKGISSDPFNAAPENKYTVATGHDCPGPLCKLGVDLEPEGYYSYLWHMDTGMSSKHDLQYILNINYLIRNEATYYRKYLIGGGVRIGAISYRDVDFKILGSKKYDYNFSSETNRSSGSLAFPKPVYSYRRSVRHTMEWSNEDCKFLDPFFAALPISYNTTTSSDNLQAFSTQGGNVGYKEVSVSQTGLVFNSEMVPENKDNGKTLYTYTSPIDFPVEGFSIDYTTKPNPSYGIPYPYLSSVNQDFKRGILKSEKFLDTNNKLLSENLYEYAFSNREERIGFRAYSQQDCPFAKKYATYSAYMAEVNNCIPNNFNHFICYNCGDTQNYIAVRILKEEFAWVQLKEKITNNYFYDKSNVRSTIQSKETYDYNFINKQLSYFSKTIYKGLNLFPEKIEQNYNYFTSNSLAVQQNDILKLHTTTQLRNGMPISNQIINYSTSISPGSSRFLPETIGSAKANDLPETKVRFIQYNVFGNPLEIQKENGIHVVYIYDYNNQNVIAVIENATYAEVLSTVGSSLNPYGYTEMDVPAFNGLRASLPQSNVKTYTYKPLIGIKSITDARGQKSTYEYDDFGRLVRIKDHKDNILSEYSYKYYNQN